MKGSRLRVPETTENMEALFRSEKGLYAQLVPYDMIGYVTAWHVIWYGMVRYQGDTLMHHFRGEIGHVQRWLLTFWYLLGFV